MATITLVQSNTAASSAASPTSIAPALSAASTAGNFLVLVVCVTGTTPSITTPAGWSSIRNAVSNSVANGVFIIPNNAGGITTVTVTIAGTGGGAAAAIFEFSGLGASPSQEFSFGNASSGSTQFSTPAGGGAGNPIPLPDTGEFLFVAALFQAATINNTSGTSPEFAVNGAIGTAVSTSGVPNAQVACYWGVSQIGSVPRVVGNLSASVAWLTQYLRYIGATSSPIVYNNAGGSAGILVASGGVSPAVGGSASAINSGYGGEVPGAVGSGAFFSGMIGG